MMAMPCLHPKFRVVESVAALMGAEITRMWGIFVGARASAGSGSSACEPLVWYHENKIYFGRWLQQRLFNGGFLGA